VLLSGAVAHSAAQRFTAAVDPRPTYSENAMSDHITTGPRTARVWVACLLLAATSLLPSMAYAGSAWTGSGSVNIEPASTAVVNDGTAAPAVFAYSAGTLPPGGPCCGRGNWAFQTTATAAGAVAVDWSYTGFHAYFEVTVGLSAFVTSGGVTTTYPLVNDGPADCCTPPSGGFAYAGPFTFNVSAGDTYGFVMSGQNGDSDGRLQGTLTVAPAGYVPPPAPALLQAYEITGGAYLIGLAANTPNTPVTLQAYSAPTCTDGVLAGGGIAVGPPVTATTDASGYFGATVTGVPLGDFVAVAITAPVATARSACVIGTGNNDFWPKALDLGASSTVRDYLDTAGKARWYKVKVTPGQRIQVTLSNLPADYDLAVFRDIAAAFAAQLVPANAAELTKLSAEFAPSVFSPSVFSPSVFSPSVFSPDAYSPSVFSPSVFSPSVFSPSVFSPSVFSPSVFSPSVFSPSVFSPSVFSPSVFSPSVFSPSVFSPSVFSPTDVAQAFSSAQTRSIIGVSATPGVGDESVIVSSWNSNEDFYIRVAGRAGAFSTAGQFTVTVARSATTCSNVTDTAVTARAAAAAGGYKTIVLTDSSKVDLNTALPGGGTLAAKLQAFVARPEVAGVLVDVAGDARVGQLKQQAQDPANILCPYATNLVAEEIKSIVDTYRPNNPGLRYVVVAGNDSVIPFFRYPDQSLLGQESGYVPPLKSQSASDASLRADYVLSQDAYGAGTRISVRTNAFPIPGLAVGRLVETPAEIAGMLDAYAGTNGAVTPRTSLVTGYDFLADAAGVVKGEFDAGTGAAGDFLIAPNNISPQDPSAWTAAQLKAALLGPVRHDVVFLAGHFSANSALAADFATSLITTDLAAAGTDFTNAIVMSAGCHSGYNIVDADAITGVTLPLDWAQAFAQKKATLIAGTGYQYGDTDFLEYSERLYANVARQLRAGSGPVAVGEALVKAKLAYLAATPDIRGIHEKALLEATLFGLPMLAVNMPAGRTPPPPPAGAITPVPVAAGPGANLALGTYDYALDPNLSAASTTLANLAGGSIVASWLTGPDGVVTNPAEPALPLAVYDVTATNGNLVLRGVGFRGGRYADTTVVPLTGAPTTDLRGVHVPFVSPVFYPMRPWTINYFGALGGTGGTRLLLTPAQHRAVDVTAGTSVQRKFTHLDLRLFYSGNYDPALRQASLSDAPTIVALGAQPAGSDAIFTAQVVSDPAAAVHQAWITYTDGSGAWVPLDLAQCVAPLPAACGTTADSRLWKARLVAAPAMLQYVVQAASGTGLVSLDDNRGAYYAFAASAPPPPPAVPATTLAIVSAPASARFGDTASITVRLTSAGAAVAGNTVTVAVGGATRSGTTAADGSVTLSVPVSVTPGSYSIVASFAGSTALQASSAAGSISVGQAATSVTPISVPGPGVTLVATVGTPAQAQPLLQAPVTFSLTGPAGAKTQVGTTDYLGRALVNVVALAPGAYAGTASFAGNATYAAASAALSFIVKATQTIGPIATTPSAPVYAPGSTFLVTATATSGLPVTVASLSPGICSTGGGNGAVVTMLAPGLCTLSAQQVGNDYYFAATQVIQPVTIAKGTQAITFAGPGNQTLGTPPLALTATASSGLPVAFAAAGSCTVSGATLTLTTTGSCTVTASQTGNANFNAAASVARTVLVDIANLWTPTAGRMTTPRSHHTATRFESGPLAGSVLIAGGVDDKGNPLASAELYNPATRKFVATDKLHGKSSDHTATLLQDGRVLVVGGGNGSADVYDPATQSWSVIGGSGSNRSLHTATRLPDGRVLIVGGADNGGKTLSSTIVFNPANGGSFASGPTLDTARERHTATLLTSGPNANKVLIVGGRYSSGKNYVALGTYQLCDATSCMPSRTGVAVRFKHAAVALVAVDGSRKVLVTGGTDGTNLLATSDVYDVATGTWDGTSAGTLTPARKALTVSALANGRALVAGGRGKAAPASGKAPITAVDVYTPPFASAMPMSVPRSWHAATPLLDAGGNVVGVLVTGGKTVGAANAEGDDDDDGAPSTDGAEVYGRP
jgi:hypothetical protein